MRRLPIGASWRVNRTLAATVHHCDAHVCQANPLCQRLWTRQGDMVVDVPYVMRRCQEDKDMAAVDDDDEEEAEERGVSGAMAQVYSAETRIQMLLVHGMLHLVGYDHEEDDDYALMVAREEELLRELGMPLPSTSQS
jgi:hypothetical protein